MQKKKISKAQLKNNPQDNFNLTLVNQNGNKNIIAQLNSHITMEDVNQIMGEIIEQNQTQENQIIGVENIFQDPLLDYKIYKGIGYLSRNIQFKFLYQNLKLEGLNKYKLLKCLATGGFSKVYLARSLVTGDFMAAKFVDKLKVPSDDKKQLILNEKYVNQSTDYPFLVKMHEFIETDNFYIFIMDYCPGGELFYLLRSIKRMSEQQARIYFLQILLGIQYLHKQGIMYRDLKPQNIMIDETGHTKITDFGLAKYYKQKSFSFCGSIQYMSPEIVTNSGHSFEVDYYCLGALLYELLIGCPPFYDPDLSQYQTKKNIAYLEVQFPQNYGLSHEVKDLIGKLLVKNPKQRLGHLGGAKQIMFHPWVGKINRTLIQSKNYSVPYVPDLSKFNFDSSQIGLSQERFTHKIKHQYKILQNRALTKNRKYNHEKKQSSQKQQKQSLRKGSISRQKSLSPYKKKYSNSCQKIQNENKNFSNILSKKNVANPFGKFKNIMREEFNKRSHKKILSKGVCPSFMTLQKKKLAKKNCLDMYITKKFQTVKTESNQNTFTYGFIKKLKKQNQLSEQSQPFSFIDISDKINSSSSSNLTKLNLKINDPAANTYKQPKYKLNKNNQLKKSSNIKIKKTYNNQNSTLKSGGLFKPRETTAF